MENWDWPEWVPEAVKAEIERFHVHHNGVRGWHYFAKINVAPAFGSIVSLEKLSPNGDFCNPGKFVFCWNNIGRVVHEDGSFDYVSFVSRQDDILQYLA